MTFSIKWNPFTVNSLTSYTLCLTVGVGNFGKVGVRNFGKVGVGVGHFTSDLATVFAPEKRNKWMLFKTLVSDSYAFL